MAVCIPPEPIASADRGAHAVGELSGDADVLEKHEAPPAHLRPIAQVQVLGERIGLPPAGILQAAAAPHAGGAVEVEEAAATVTSSLFEEEVTVQQHALRSRQPVVAFVQMVPAGLDHTYVRETERG